MRLLIARHAEDFGTNYSEEERILTQKGIEQAKRLGKLIREFNPTHLYCSPLLRSKQTAEIVAELCKIKPNVMELIKEQEYGNEESSDEIRDLNQGYVTFSQKYRGGESYGDLYRRAKEAWKKIQERHDLNSRIVIITHGRFMTFLIAEILGFKPDGFFLANANIAYLIFEISQHWRPMLVLPIAGKEYC